MAKVKWELVTYPVSIVNGDVVDVSVIWTAMDGNTGKTPLVTLTELADDGWELVSVTPLNINGTTTALLYTFKRRK